MHRVLILLILVASIEVVRAENRCQLEHEEYHDPKEKHPLCLVGCKAGCYCARGYLRDTTTGECVKATEDKVKCKPNEQLRCGDYECALFCGNYIDPLCFTSRLECGYE